MNRAQKSDLVQDLNGVFSNTTVVVVAHYSGMTVNDMVQLRGRMSEAGAAFRVTKNRLTKLALEGTPCDGIADLFSGPTAIAYSDDPVAAPKVMVDFAKENEKLIVLGGIMEQTILDPNGVKELASLPSLDELRAKILGMLSTPATRIAGVLQAPGGQLARVVGAYAAQEETA